jgi:hypothetical protein
MWLLVFCGTLAADERDRLNVGVQPDGTIVVPTNQVLKPAGEQVLFPGRPVDLLVVEDGRTLVVKNMSNLVFIDVATAAIKQTLASSVGLSVVGLAAKGDKVYASDAKDQVHVAQRQQDGSYQWVQDIGLIKPNVGGAAHPSGMALRGDTELWVGETFAVTDGRLERAKNMNELFDSDQQYAETFHDGRLTEELGRVVLCYKCRTYCHNTVARELASGRATFVDRAKLLLWALVCQGLLNQKDSPDLMDEFGGDLRMPSDFRERLYKIAVRQVKPTLLWLVQQKEFSDAYKEERYEFLRGDKAFNRSMSHALQAYGWRQTRLGRPLPTVPRFSRKAVLMAT